MRLRAGLARKGFCRSHTDHRYFILYVNEKKEAATFLSHGKNQDIGAPLLNAMAKELGLTTKEFIDLVKCPLSTEEFLAAKKEASKWPADIEAGLIKISQCNCLGKHSVLDVPVKCPFADQIHLSRQEGLRDPACGPHDPSSCVQAPSLQRCPGRFRAWLLLWPQSRRPEGYGHYACRLWPESPGAWI